MKVFCSECEYCRKGYQIGIHHCVVSGNCRETWFAREDKNGAQMPQWINKNNDCGWYEEGTLLKTMVKKFKLRRKRK